MSPSKINREVIEALQAQIVEAAIVERHPVDVVSRSQVGLVTEASDVTELESLITSMLSEHGILPCRHVLGLVPGIAEPVRKTVYFRPAERLLQEALDDDHPIVLATTVETQRYVAALTRFCNEPDHRRQLWIWRGAAGRGELERVDDERPIGELEFSVARASKITDSEGAEAALKKRGARTLSLRRGDDALSCLWIPDDAPRRVIVFAQDRDVEEDAWETFAGEMLETIARELAADAEYIALHAKVVMRAESFVQVLDEVTQLPRGTVVVVPDAHHFLSFDPTSPSGASALLNIGALKDAYHGLVSLARGVKVVLLCGDLTLPKDLREEVLRVELPLPARRELFVAIRDELGSDLPEEHLVQLSEEAAGMTLAEVKAVLARARRESGGDEDERRLAALRTAKRHHISRSPALELIATGSGSRLGGMERFGSWLSVRRKAFISPEQARSVGITRPPRGVLLIGIPGSGKSLAAKVIARSWELPLVRLEMGALQDKWVGSSEARVREALRVVEAMAPCVMWIDEIDKGIAQGEGHVGHSTDLNIRATLLTWMQENRFPVFIVATANRFAQLPPELTRAGRFDARFFFGCPGPLGRQEVLNIHLSACGHDPESFDTKALVAATHGFTGAEIEQVILDGLYVSFDRGEPLTTDILLDRARKSQPLIKSAGKGLDDLWTLVDDGRVEVASDDMLSRSQVARLIDPHLYRPIYCRLEKIEGFTKQKGQADRFLMSSPFGGPAAVVMDAGEVDWLYVQTNFQRAPQDVGHFKMLDTFSSLERNFVFDTLIVEHALETIYFETKALMDRFEASPMFSAYAELFKTV